VPNDVALRTVLASAGRGICASLFGAYSSTPAPALLAGAGISCYTHVVPFPRRRMSRAPAAHRAVAMNALGSAAQEPLFQASGCTVMVSSCLHTVNQQSPAHHWWQAHCETIVRRGCCTWGLPSTSGCILR